MRKSEGNPEAFLTKVDSGKGVFSVHVRELLRLGPQLQSKVEAIPGILGWDSPTGRSRKLKLAFNNFFLI